MITSDQKGWSPNLQLIPFCFYFFLSCLHRTLKILLYVTTMHYKIFLTVLQVKDWFQNEEPSSRLNKTPPMGAPNAAICREEGQKRRKEKGKQGGVRIKKRRRQG